MNEVSKIKIIYMNMFIMSTKDYKNFGEIVKEFINIIKCIKENEYLWNLNEIYEAVLVN